MPDDCVCQEKEEKAKMKQIILLTKANAMTDDEYSQNDISCQYEDEEQQPKVSNTKDSKRRSPLFVVVDEAAKDDAASSSSIDSVLPLWQRRDARKDQRQRVDIHEANPPRHDSRPGAVAVEGPYLSEPVVDEGPHNSDAGMAEKDSLGSTTGSRTTPQPLLLDAEAEAYLVDEAGERERYRKEILGVATQAEKMEDNNRQKFRLCVLGAILFLAVAVAVPVGIMVGLRQAQGNASADDALEVDDNSPLSEDGPELVIDEDVLVSVSFRGNPKTTFIFQGNAQVRNDGLSRDKNVSSGSITAIHCRVQPCVDMPDRCRSFGMFEPSCLNSTQTSYPPCGNECPPPPDSCAFIGRSNSACTTSDCYICPPVNGQNLYVLDNMVVDVDCLHVGNATRQDNGEPYSWGIVCGVLLEGCKSEASLYPGDFVCFAGRDGAGYTDSEGGVASYVFTCALLSLMQCGCAPEGTVIPGLPASTGPCGPKDNCPFSCADQEVDATKLCRSFPGDIEWFERGNPFRQNAFILGMMGWTDYKIEIYIKDGLELL